MAKDVVVKPETGQREAWVDMRNAPTIELRTLGTPQLRGDGAGLQQLATHRQKLAVLIYLAIEGPVSRDQLLAMFWPERGESRARHSLSQALYALRSELGAQTIVAEGGIISIEPDVFSVDAIRFEQAVEGGNWGEAIDLYEGPFLEGFHLPGAPGFDEWLTRTRSRLGRLARIAFSKRLERLHAQDDTASALALAWRWTALEPLEDEAQHALISLLARTGKRTAALEQYDAYRERLAQELGVEPLEETVALVEEIKRGVTPTRTTLSGESDPGAPDARQGDDGGAPEATGDEAAAPVGAGSPTSEGGFFRRLREHGLVQVAAAYIAFGALSVEVTDVLIDRGVIPGFVFPFVLGLVLVGLPLTLILTWTQASERYASEQRGGEVPTAKLRTGQVLAVLGALVVGLLVGRLLIERVGRDSATAAGLDPLHVAVLYFDDLTEDGHLSHLSEGFTKALITELTQVDTLTVASPNAVKSYRDRDVPLDRVIEVLGVGTLVEGSLMESEDQLRLDVHLVDAASMNTIASLFLRRPRRETLELVDDLAREVSTVLRRELGVKIRHRELRAGTDNAEAWELVQRGEALRDDSERLWEAGDTAAAASHLDRAESMLTRAESLDPDWIEPIVLRGWIDADRARLFARTYGEYDASAARSGLSQAERALKIEPRSARALELRGILRSYLWQVAGDAAEADTLRTAAERDLRAATLIDPSRALALSRLSDLLHRSGRFSEAKLFAERAYKADAFLSDLNRILFRLCYISFDQLDVADVERWCSEGRRRFPGEGGYTEIELATLSSSRGGEPDLDRAWRLFEARQRAVPPQRRDAVRPEGLMYVAAVAARAGLRDSALTLTRQAWADAEAENPLLHYYEANVYQQLGDHERAIESLAAYLRAEPQRREYLARDWYFEDIRADPSFQALVVTDS